MPAVHSSFTAEACDCRCSSDDRKGNREDFMNSLDCCSPSFVPDHSAIAPPFLQKKIKHEDASMWSQAGSACQKYIGEHEARHMSRKR